MKNILNLLIGLLMAGSLQSQTGTQIRDTLFHGINRTYVLYIPASYFPGHPVPLLISLHGFTESADYQNSLANFKPIADTANFIIAMPDGRPNPVMFGFVGWNMFPTSSGVDDPGFLAALIDTVSAKYSIDAGRVYFTGHSSGAIMSYELACSMSHKIAAIAPVNGFMFQSFINSCTPTHPMPVMEIHGTADPVRNWNGEGPVTKAVNMDTLINHWVRFNGCSTVPLYDSVPNISTTDNCWAQHFTYSGGRAGSSVEVYKVINGGHTWPGSSVLEPYGNTNQDFNACAVIWNFLSRYSLSNLMVVPEIQTGGGPFMVYPNPVSGVLTIRAKETAPIRQIRVCTLTGQEVLRIGNPIYQTDIPIDTSDWNSGIYLIMITHGKNSSNHKVIKE